MKRLIVILAVLLLLVAGALGGAYVLKPELLGIHKAEEAKAPEPPPPEKPAKPATVRVDTLNVPVVIDGAPQRQVYVTFTLIARPDAQAKVADGLPRYRNAVIEFCYRAFPEQYAAEGRMDLRRLKVTLLKLAQRSFGDDVEDVLIQSYFET